MTSEIKVKYESGNEYTLIHELKGSLRVYRNGIFVGSIGIATLASNLEARFEVRRGY